MSKGDTNVEEDKKRGPGNTGDYHLERYKRIAEDNSAKYIDSCESAQFVMIRNHVLKTFHRQ